METKIAPKSSLFRSDAMQRVLAFGGLIALFVVFSLASPVFSDVRQHRRHLAGDRR